MKNKFMLFFLFGLLGLLLSGCISQTFYQKVERNGNSEIQATMDFSPLITIAAAQSKMSKNDLVANLSNELPKLCENITRNDPQISCSAEGTKLILKRSFAPDGSYYTFSSEAGIPYITYKVVVNKIPVDKFSIKSSASALLPSGSSSLPQTEQQKPIDLTAKEENKIGVATMKTIMPGIEMKYIIEMPGEITMAAAGSVPATVNGSTATFDLLKVFEDSAPLTVESRELNTTMLLLIGLVVVVIIVAVAFFLLKRQ